MNPGKRDPQSNRNTILPYEVFSKYFQMGGPFIVFFSISELHTFPAPAYQRPCFWQCLIIATQSKSNTLGLDSMFDRVCDRALVRAVT